MRIKISDITLKNNEIEFNYDLVDNAPYEPPPTNNDTNQNDLPEGAYSDKQVGLGMLLKAMNEHDLTPVGVQGQGDIIVNALRDTWRGLKVYVHPTSDAPMWYGFGPIDVTIDSGKGGWSFQTPGTPDMFDMDYYRSIYGDS
jgi:hypothetical protein